MAYISFKDQPVFSVLVGALLVVLTAFAGVRTWNAVLEQKYIGKPATFRDTITIDGVGKVTAKPTLALVQFGVVTQGATAAAAQRDNSSKMNAVIQAMQELGVKKDDIETSGYYLNPNYNYDKSPYTIIGYSVNQNVSAKVRDFEKIGQVLERGVALGINQVNTVQFSIDDPTSLRDDARMKALEDARKKADALAKALDVDVVRVVSFAESPANAPGPVPMYYREAATSADAGSAPTIQSGTQDVEMNVSVTFEIR